MTTGIPGSTKRLTDDLRKLHGSSAGAQRRHQLAGIREASDAGVLDPPADLSEVQRELWQHAVENAPRGTLRSTDHAVLRVWCAATDMHQRAVAALASQSLIVPGPSGGKLNPLVAIVDKAATKVLAASAQLGFAPIVRPRLAGLALGPLPAPVLSDRLPTGRPAKRRGPRLVSLSEYVASHPDNVAARKAAAKAKG